ncbi:MAG TPA: hypothetical protein VN541_08420, partial [Tepidisphaeraceae bacterium]|nr:hypothetical protein [Tepidisphaeraceae bacterium]
MPRHYHVVLLPEAESEALAAAQYIAHDSPRNAAGWYAGLEKAINSLELFPHRCAIAPDRIRASILAVFGLVRDFGYNQTSLISKNALLPVIYWIHHRDLAEGIKSQVGLRNERATIRRWLHTVLLKGVFGSAADTILAAIRRAFVGDRFGSPFIKAEVDQFPADAIAKVIRAQGKDPQVDQ